MWLYYLYSENKGADQLRGHHAADCFCKCKRQVLSRRGSYGMVLRGFSGFGINMIKK